MTRFSIVVPTLNNQDTILDCIYSIVEQTFEDYEILICDGGSTDETLNILSKLHNQRISIVSDSDTGVANALNKGFSKANGEILCWINADDLLASQEVLERVNETFTKSNVDACYGHQIVVSEGGEHLRHLVAFKPMEKYLRYGGNIFTGSLYFTKNAWKEFGSFPEDLRYAFEYPLYIFLFSLKEVALCDDFLGKFRIRKGSLSSTNDGRMLVEKERVFKNHDEKGRVKVLIARAVSQFRQKTLAKAIFYKIIDSYNRSSSIIRRRKRSEKDKEIRIHCKNRKGYR